MAEDQFDSDYEAEIRQIFEEDSDDNEFEGFDLEDILPNLRVRSEIRMDNAHYDREFDSDIELNWARKDEEPTHHPFTREPKLNVEIAEDADPIDYFNLFFEQSMWQNIMTETNRYAERRKNGSNLKPNSRLAKWISVTVDELKIFFALFIIMGIVQKDDIEMYWTTQMEISTPYFNEKMSKDRFLAILSNLHLCNSENETQYGQDGHDPLFKLRQFITMCQNKFVDVYTPERDLSFDEATCPWKGRLRFKVYNPAKPDKFGIKLYSVNEAKSGYCIGFDVYVGSSPVVTYAELVDLNQDCTSTTKIVVGMLAKCGLLDSGHHVYMDNYYSSPELFDELDFHNTYACGTIRQNRKEYPVALRQKRPKMKKGDVLYRRRDNLLAVKFHDKRDVNMLTTIHSAKLAVLEKTDANGEPVIKPTCIVDYCSYMGGVDLGDQFMKNYSVLRRTVKWWKKLFFFMLNLTLTNSYALYRKYGVKGMTHQQYRLCIARALIDSATDAPRPQKRGRKIVNTDDNDRLTQRHFPAFNLAKPGAKRQRPARDCFACNQSISKRDGFKRNQSSFHCPQCNVVLCVPRCFEIYHTYKNYRQILTNGQHEADE